MKLRLAAEINKMPQKPEQSTRAAYKRSWRIAILTVGTMLLHTIATVTVTVDGTAIAMATTVATMLTTVAATPSLNPSTTGFLRRSIRVAYNGNAVIVCKAAERSRTVFLEVLENRISIPLNVTNADLDPYAVLLLKGIKQNATYRCMERGQLLSETILTIAAPDLTSPEQIQMGSGDDAALVFVHNGDSNINYSKQSLPRDYNDIRDEEIKALDIDRYTKILLISNASAQKSVFTFTYGDGQRSNECELDVGKAPESVKSFLCIGENYESMRCAITFPPNNLATEYRITYKISNYPMSCKLDDSLDVKLDDNTKNITLLAKNTDTCIYYPNADIYNFTVITSNVLGQFMNEYSINNHEHVVPAKLHVNLSDITSNSVRLTWFNALKNYYIYGLVYDIAVKPVGFEKYSITADSSCLEYNCVLTNLNYAYWNYSLYVRARVNLPTSEWNKPTQLDFQTAQRTPDRAPYTYAGGFHINQNKITLYWEDLAAHERNGPSFTYVIQVFDMHGQELLLRETVETTISFRWLDTPRIYKVYAKNAVGVSPNVSMIQVVPPRDLNPPQEIEKLFENGIFKLKWKQPRDNGKQPPINYTVFWCRSTMTECEGNMHFELVDNTITEYALHSKSQHIMAVAANYPNGSSGLYRTTCFANLNGSLEKATLVVNAKSESRISLGWFHQNCRSAFDGYNITYCVWNNVTESNCLSVTENVSRSKGFILTNLKTYTFYTIRVQLYGKNNRRSPPSAVIVCQTNEAAPEPPTNLYYEAEDITSHTAKISWQAPTVTNGVLRKYYVWYKKHNEARANYTEVSSTQQSVTIDKLSSGAIYEVWLTAWTSKQSNKSASVHITTMIGIPTRPENVTLERDGGEYVLSWDAVEYAVDHMEFFELIFNDNHIRRILTVQRVSGSAKRHECRLKYTDCTEGVQNMQVRAVNVIADKDLDKSAFAIADEGVQRQRRNADPAYNGSVVAAQTTTKGDIAKGSSDLPKKRFADEENKTAKMLAYKYKFYNDFECEQIDAGIRTQLPYVAAASYYMLKSEAESSKTNFNCSTFPWKILTASCIFVSMFVATVLWSYKVVRRQLKFHVQLPESVLQLMSVNTKLPSCLEDTKPENISIVSTKASDGTSLIYIGDTFAPTSSSESGVASVGDGDTEDTPSTSSEEADREVTRCLPTSEPTTPQTTIILNMFNQQSPLRGGREPNKSIIMDDVAVEQTKPIISNDSGTSSEFSYLPLHALKADKTAAQQQKPKLPIFGQTTNNNNTNVNNKNIFNNLPLVNGYVMNDSLHKLSTAHASVDPVEMKYAQAQPQFIQATDNDDYVLQYTPHMLPTVHNTPMRADNNQAENPLQQLFSQAQTAQLAADDCGYVPHDPLPLNAATHSFALENELSRKSLTQPFIQTNCTHAQPNIFKNMALTKSGYVLPDSLVRVGAPHNATSTADNDDTKMSLPQQVQPMVSYGYVTRN